VSDLDALVWAECQPTWASAALQRAPWAVMRRAVPRADSWPIGVRGSVRAQRSAAWLPKCAVKECITPQMLAAVQAWRGHPGALTVPAIAVLDQVAVIINAHGFTGRWGPCGSVGFELASGVPSTTSRSDLDLMLTADEPIARGDAARLHAELSELPVRIDLLLETPIGAVVLAEYVERTDMLMLRSEQGPRLVRNLWSAGEAAVNSQ
jgi:phosphoribosyl-dephospho-CoA transferase